MGTETYFTSYTWVQDNHILPLTKVAETNKVFIKPTFSPWHIARLNIQPSLQVGVAL